MKLKTYTTLALAAIAISAIPAMAQVQITKDGRPERIFRPIDGTNASDIQFIKTAAAINLFEIKSSELAQQKSQNPFVDEFAKEMVMDHTGSYQELQEIAAKKGITLSTELPPELNRALRHLENQSGSTFDAAFENIQRNGHAQASNVFKAEIENGKDEDVKGYAVKTLPTVDMHFRMICTGQTEMGPTKMQNNN